MEIVSELQSQVVRFGRIEAEVFFPTIARAIRDRYEFVDAPSTAEEHTLGAEGVRFAMGHMGLIAIQQFRIFRDGIMIEGPGSSDDLDAFVTDLETFVTEQFGVEIGPSVLQRAYLTKFEVTPKGSVANFFDVLSPVVTALNNSVHELGFKTADYQVGGFQIVTEKIDGEPSAPRFVFERRAGFPLAANLFYSEAPLPTKAHLKLLQKLEALL